MQKNLVQRTQLKITDASKARQKLVPVCIWGVPTCVQGVRQKNSHMGRHITHNEIVRIWGLTCTRQVLEIDFPASNIKIGPHLMTEEAF